MIEFIENLDKQEFNELDSEIDDDSVRETLNDQLNSPNSLTQEQLNSPTSPTQSPSPASLTQGLPFVLDFTLNGAKERAEFITRMLSHKKTPLTARQIDLISTYLFYGKDEEDGKSPVQRKELSVSTRYGRQAHPTSSLDELLEQPGFNETLNFEPKTRYIVPKPSFSREENADLAPQLGGIWETIDLYEFMIKVREEGLKKEDMPPAYQPFYERALSLTGRQIYDIKHRVVEMRREQYTIRDCFKPTSFTQKNAHVGKYFGVEEEEGVMWDDPESALSVRPMGLYIKGMRWFERPDSPETPNLPERASNPKFVLDFTNPDHIIQIVENFQGLMSEALSGNPDSNARNLLNTLNFYVEGAELRPEHADIFKLKLDGRSNAQIAEIINEIYGKSHTQNYISTLYRKTICPQIAAFAQYHWDTYRWRRFPMKWKICNRCGQRYLRDERNFVRKSRNWDGVANRCKKCDKLIREGLMSSEKE